MKLVDNAASNPAAERREGSNPSLAKYKALMKIARQVHREMKRLALWLDRDPNLQGLCAIASHRIYLLALEQGIEADFVHGFVRTPFWPLSLTKFQEENADGFHCWIEFNGLIIDVTASQNDYLESFCGSDIFITTTRDPRYIGKIRNKQAELLVSQWGDWSRPIYFNNPFPESGAYYELKKLPWRCRDLRRKNANTKVA